MKDIPQATSHQQPCPILQRAQTGACVRTGPNGGLSIVKRSSRWSLELICLIISPCPPQTQNNTKVFNDLEIFGASQLKHTKASWQSWPSIVFMGRNLDLRPWWVLQGSHLACLRPQWLRVGEPIPAHLPQGQSDPVSVVCCWLAPGPFLHISSDYAAPLVSPDYCGPGTILHF